MIQAIVFDMDGLLVDSETYWDEARRLMVTEQGRHWDWNEDDQNAVMGTSTSTWVTYMIERFALNMSRKIVEETVIRNIENLYRQRVPFLPGAKEAVVLAADSFPVGLASGSPRNLIDLVTADQAIQGMFRVILSGDQFARGKPSPDIYLAAAAELGVPAADCICFEDSGNGIIAGKNAGMKVIAVPDARFSPAAEILAQADTILNSLLHFSLETLTELSGTRYD